jgi:hypothetical protein
MNRLNFIKAITLLAISSTIICQTNLPQIKETVVVPNICSNKVFELDYDKHDIVISNRDSDTIMWQNCEFHVKNMPQDLHLMDYINNNFKQGYVKNCFFKYT